ncbi:uncharacterized protein F5891DRAFT_1170565 [Suillus fuscotomentosus]|uniref:Uncharacterized protein n=1 Tax=Suillus fuscotomentosus TaxID=1912939 RepID=A0AAD4EH82_9AGAM|nr:uncharacterized protein F5891DRAFT_1170565 [Suillus fuscotomentosus]KAG1904923.1 hypothetical protein F5891DRAFT_1170565 [Suillus fuscotomentosus]
MNWTRLVIFFSQSDGSRACLRNNRSMVISFDKCDFSRLSVWLITTTLMKIWVIGTSVAVLARGAGHILGAPSKQCYRMGFESLDRWLRPSWVWVIPCLIRNYRCQGLGTGLCGLGICKFNYYSALIRTKEFMPAQMLYLIFMIEIWTMEEEGMMVHVYVKDLVRGGRAYACLSRG